MSSRVEPRQTVSQIMEANHFERGRLSRFLHDDVAQNLSAVGLQLDLLRMDLEAAGASQSSAAVVEIQQVLDAVMERVRDFSYELDPPALERDGLRAALERLATRTRQRFPGAVQLSSSPGLNLSRHVAGALYRIAREAVHNTLRHAACSRIDITVKSGRGGVTLEVRDNGRGFDLGDPSGGRRGRGLVSMEHYAAETGLDLAVTSQPGGGTVVRAGTAAPRKR
jgi:signal transduction histidine kinase